MSFNSQHHAKQRSFKAEDLNCHHTLDLADAIMVTLHITKEVYVSMGQITELRVLSIITTKYLAWSDSYNATPSSLGNSLLYSL
uniref:Uncharacterized protein n=1 Tax=Megaselia scalaris TaxID=36166 RepID=T1GEN9_MEGSC